MRYVFALLFILNTAFAGESETSKPAVANEQTTATDGIDFNEWESEFDQSMRKTKTQVKKCDNKSKNCDFKKLQALEPESGIIH